MGFIINLILVLGFIFILALGIIASRFRPTAPRMVRRSGDPLPPPEPPETPKLEIGETIEIGDARGWYMRDLHTGNACRIGKGNIIRLLAEKNGFVLIEYVRAGQESASNCPVGARGILSVEEYLTQRSVEKKIFEKDRDRREAIAFFRGGK